MASEIQQAAAGMNQAITSLSIMDNYFPIVGGKPYYIEAVIPKGYEKSIENNEWLTGLGRRLKRNKMAFIITSVVHSVEDGLYFSWKIINQSGEIVEQESSTYGVGLESRVEQLCEKG